MLNKFDRIPRNERVIVALDCDKSTAIRIANDLKGCATWLKVGMTLFYQEGPSIVARLKDMGFKIFVDLKFYDIPHQVAGAALACAAAGADMMTMHAIGGMAMMKGAQEQIDEFCLSNKSEIATLAVSVLTSYTDDDLAFSGVKRSTEEQIKCLCLMAQEAKMSGVVASTNEALMLRNLLGSDAYIVCPGVRPLNSAKDDQCRTTTPSVAFDSGASHIVVGRPITKDMHVYENFSRIIEEL